jgi:hypothetical protein
MTEHPQCIQQPLDREALAQAAAVYVSIWNMDCPDCATWLHNGLIQLESVLKVDVFYQQGIGVIFYSPGRMTRDELLNVIQKIGKETCHYYGAEIIGCCTAKEALRLE